MEWYEFAGKFGEDREGLSVGCYYSERSRVIIVDNEKNSAAFTGISDESAKAVIHNSRVRENEIDEFLFLRDLYAYGNEIILQNDEINRNLPLTKINPFLFCDSCGDMNYYNVFDGHIVCSNCKSEHPLSVESCRNCKTERYMIRQDMSFPGKSLPVERCVDCGRQNEIHQI